MTTIFPLIAFFLIGIVILSGSKPADFVYLRDIDPSILQSVRYCSDQNFIGRKIEGYNACEIILTKKAAEKLKKVQKEANSYGYNLLVYDGYRPQSSVNSFISWAQNTDDQKMKNLYYPRINKEKVFEYGYLFGRSSHSRGSTVDLSLIKMGYFPYEPRIEYRYLSDGTRIPYLDDGSIDMGSSFDLFDIASYQFSPLVSTAQQINRDFLKKIMEKHGFRSYTSEWWHFTLEDEPYKAKYFDFAINYK